MPSYFLYIIGVQLLLLVHTSQSHERPLQKNNFNKLARKLISETIAEELAEYVIKNGHPLRTNRLVAQDKNYDKSTEYRNYKQQRKVKQQDKDIPHRSTKNLKAPALEHKFTDANHTNHLNDIIEETDEELTIDDHSKLNDQLKYNDNLPKLQLEHTKPNDDLPKEQHEYYEINNKENVVEHQHHPGTQAQNENMNENKPNVVHAVFLTTQTSLQKNTTSNKGTSTSITVKNDRQVLGRKTPTYPRYVGVRNREIVSSSVSQELKGSEWISKEKIKKPSTVENMLDQKLLGNAQKNKSVSIPPLKISTLCKGMKCKLSSIRKHSELVKSLYH